MTRFDFYAARQTRDARPSRLLDALKAVVLVLLYSVLALWVTAWWWLR